MSSDQIQLLERWSSKPLSTTPLTKPVLQNQLPVSNDKGPPIPGLCLSPTYRRSSREIKKASNKSRAGSGIPYKTSQ
jgi:hypothetical protein